MEKGKEMRKKRKTKLSNKNFKDNFRDVSSPTTAFHQTPLLQLPLLNCVCAPMILFWETSRSVILLKNSIYTLTICVCPINDVKPLKMANLLKSYF